MLTSDQLNRSIEITAIPKKIISLVPSQTELLYDLGLREEVAGITKFCIHPDEWFRCKTIVGGTKKYDFEKIKSLQPDLIIGNKEENEQTQIQQLMKLYPVWMSDIKTLDDSLAMICSLGEIVNRKEKAKEISNQISLKFQSIKPNSKKTCAYFIWKKPYMCVGANTFIDEMLQRCNLENVFSNNGRYPEITEADLTTKQPEVILLSSEPFPFKEADKRALQRICPNSKIEIVDGELFSWYGSRLLKSVDYFTALLKKL